MLMLKIKKNILMFFQEKNILKKHTAPLKLIYFQCFLFYFTMLMLKIKIYILIFFQEKSTFKKYLVPQY
jgi:hypothetical protein